MKLRYSARTDVGKKREINEDSYGPETLGPDRPQGQLIVLCDGMGGHAAGEVASSIGVETILEAYYSTPGDDRVSALQRAFEEANQRIYRDGHGNMGTTGVAALIHNGIITIANVGDSRAYLVHRGEIKQVSHDHSYVSEQVDAGLLTPEQARTSVVRNIITRALGHQADVRVDIFNERAYEGDVVVLSSDGLHGLIEDEVIQEAVRLLPPEEATEKLIKLANQSGGTDNITVVVTRLDRLDDSVDAATEELPLVPGRATLRLPETSNVESVPVAAASAVPSAPVEHPLSRKGVLLALLTLLVLVGGGGLAMLYPFTSTVLTTAPATAPTTFSSPMPIMASPSPAAVASSTPARATAVSSPFPSTPVGARAPSAPLNSASPQTVATATP